MSKQDNPANDSKYQNGRLYVYGKHGVCYISDCRKETYADIPTVLLKLQQYFPGNNPANLGVNILKAPTELSAIASLKQIEEALKILSGEPKNQTKIWSRRKTEFDQCIATGDILKSSEVLRDTLGTSRDEIELNTAQIHEFPVGGNIAYSIREVGVDALKAVSDQIAVRCGLLQNEAIDLVVRATLEPEAKSTIKLKDVLPEPPRLNPEEHEALIQKQADDQEKKERVELEQLAANLEEAAKQKAKEEEKPKPTGGGGEETVHEQPASKGEAVEAKSQKLDQTIELQAEILELKRKLEGQETAISEKDEQITGLKSRIIGLELIEEQFQSAQNSIDKLRENLSSLTQESDLLQKKFSDVSSERDDLKAQLKEALARIETLQEHGLQDINGEVDEPDIDQEAALSSEEVEKLFKIYKWILAERASEGVSEAFRIVASTISDQDDRELAMSLWLYNAHNKKTVEEIHKDKHGANGVDLEAFQGQVKQLAERVMEAARGNDQARRFLERRIGLGSG